MSDMRHGRKSRLERPILAQGSNDRSFSNTTGKTNGNGMRGICSYHSTIPDTGLIPIGHIANDAGGGCHKGVVRSKGRFAQKGHVGAVARENLLWRDERGGGKKRVTE